jgi:branched-chain amino acid transport system ATP-binding protein
MAISLMAWPRLLMLDEPVAGLSAAEADHVRDTIRRVRDRGISLVVIDHNMRFMANLCERILVVHHGQELAHGTPQEVPDQSGGDRSLSGTQICPRLNSPM